MLLLYMSKLWNLYRQNVPFFQTIGPAMYEHRFPHCYEVLAKLDQQGYDRSSRERAFLGSGRGSAGARTQPPQWLRCMAGARKNASAAAMCWPA